MSSIFSDPGWRRGSTLLNNETIELDGAGNPVAGNELVGQVKVFQDVHPSTGVRYSNRLVYCIAARYIGSSDINVNGADAGRAYVLSRRNGLGLFADVAGASDVTDRTVGILDEYLTETVRPNDIVWLVVKGPVTARKGNTIVIPGGLGAEVASANGLVVAKATQANMIGTVLESAVPAATTAASTTGASATVAISIPTALFASVVEGAPITGHANLPANAHVAAAPSSVSVSGSNTLATITIAGTTATAVPSGTTLFIGGPLRTATTCRLSLACSSI